MGTSEISAGNGDDRVATSTGGPATSALPEGDQSDPRTIVGPLISRDGAEQVAGLVADAVVNGAPLLQGGGAFYPAVLGLQHRPENWKRVRDQDLLHKWLARSPLTEVVFADERLRP